MRSPDVERESLTRSVLVLVVHPATAYRAYTSAGYAEESCVPADMGL